MKQTTSSFLDQHRFLLAFAALSSFMGVSVGLAKVATALYSLQLGAGETMLGLIAGAQMVGVLIISLPVGFLVDQLGPKRLFVFGSALAGLIYLAVPLVPSAEFLLVCTALISFCMPLRFVSLNTIFMQQLDVVGESKAGWYRGSHMLGMFLLGPMIAPGLIGLINFDGVFWLIAAIFVLTIILSPMVLNHYDASHGLNRRMGRADIRSQLLLLAGDRQLREVSLIEFFCHAINMFYSFFILVIAINDLHMDTVKASGLVVAQGVVYVLALFFLGGPAGRLGQTRTYRLSFATITIALVILGLAAQLTTLWLGALLLGLGSGTLEIVNLTRFARLGAQLGRGKVAGLNALAGPGGALLGSLAGGVVGHFFSLQSVFLLSAPVFALFWLHTWLARPGPWPISKVYFQRFSENGAALILFFFIATGVWAAFQPAALVALERLICTTFDFQ